MLIVLAHDGRKVLHFNVTEHPTAQWTARQLVEAFPWETAPKYLLRDRDAVYGDWFQRRVASLGVEQVLIAPRGPWQNAYAERLIGSICRECLDHVIVLSAAHLWRLLTRYFHYYLGGARISRWPWIAPKVELCNCPTRGGSSGYRTWVGYIIIMRGWPHDIRCRDVAPNRIAWGFGTDRPKLPATGQEQLGSGASKRFFLLMQPPLPEGAPEGAPGTHWEESA